jgi:hypothetical protein
MAQIEDTFVVWSHGPVSFQLLLHYLNSLKPTIKFRMEVKVNDNFLFLEILIMERGPKLATKVYRKPTHAFSYLHFKCKHPRHVKRGVVHASISSPKVICQDYKNFNREIENISHDLTISKYPQVFLNSAMKLSRNLSSFFRHNIPGHGHYPIC